jgi:hypothetical protein
VVSSNQDRNVGALPGHNEAGSMRFLADKVVAHLESLDVTAQHFAPALESTDKTQYAALYKTFPEARAWCDQRKAAGDQTLILHLHSDAGGGSHSGYCYSTKRPESTTLGKACAENLRDLLGTAKVLGFDRTDWLWDKQAGQHNAAYLEVWAHDVKSDLEAAYRLVDGAAAAIALEVRAWGAPVDYRALYEQERTRNAELAAALTRTRATVNDAIERLRAV